MVPISSFLAVYSKLIKSLVAKKNSFLAKNAELSLILNEYERKPNNKDVLFSLRLGCYKKFCWSFFCHKIYIYLDLWDCLGKVKHVLQQHFIGLI